MSTGPRRARVSALAKINLALRVLRRRPDGFHELRTIYQTISLADSLELEFTPSRGTRVEMRCDPEIPDNLVVRAARLVMDTLRITGRVALRLQKRIPMGSGLGGGSSDAAAVLLALPVLAGRRVALEALIPMAAALGSDVPFFLLGGTAVGVGRGEEVYPLPDLPPARGLVLAPAVHASTRDAYRALGRRLTSEIPANIIGKFQSCASVTGFGAPAEGWPAPAENDFEEVVFRRHPELKLLRRQLLRFGADPVMMTGSGSALFGIFRSPEALQKALLSFRKEKVFPIALVSRARYRSLWWRRLAAHIEDRTWPPQSRYGR